MDITSRTYASNLMNSLFRLYKFNLIDIILLNGNCLTAFRQCIHLFIISDVSDTSQDANVYSVNSVISHPHLSLIISAHDDRQIRFWDSLSGKCVHSLTAHLDSVTTLSLNSKGTLLLSASHDCSIRIWDINTKLCIQEITGHRKKFGEAINAVAFHPTQHFMASAGSDALAKVY
ncbi:unnamed protein product, partial [Schistosoma margrebowiei]